MTKRKTRGRPKKTNPVSLSASDLKDLVVAEHKVSASKLNLQVHSLTRDNFVLSSNLKKVELDESVKKAAQDHRDESKRLADLMKKIETDYSVDTGKMSYDDETGIIYEDGEIILR